MNFTHDLLWKNTYNSSKTQMEKMYTKSTLLHSICTTNFGRREQFKRISILDVHCIRQSVLCMRFAAGSWYSFHFPVNSSFISPSTFFNNRLILCHQSLIRQHHCNKFHLLRYLNYLVSINFCSDDRKIYKNLITVYFFTGIYFNHNKCNMHIRIVTFLYAFLFLN